MSLTRNVAKIKTILRKSCGWFLFKLKVGLGCLISGRNYSKLSEYITNHLYDNCHLNFQDFAGGKIIFLSEAKIYCNVRNLQKHFISNWRKDSYFKIG